MRVPSVVRNERKSGLPTPVKEFEGGRADGGRNIQYSPEKRMLKGSEMGTAFGWRSARGGSVMVCGFRSERKTTPGKSWPPISTALGAATAFLELAIIGCCS